MIYDRSLGDVHLGNGIWVGRRDIKKEAIAEKKSSD